MGETVRVLRRGAEIVMGSTLHGMENIAYVFESIDTPSIKHSNLCDI